MVIYIWQRIVTPHMVGLALALVRQGSNVIYVAEQFMSEDRARQGWETPELKGAKLILTSSEIAVQQLVNTAPADSVSLCQGVRGNGLVSTAQAELRKRGLQQWVVMEMVDESGWRGLLKRLEYRRLFLQWRGHLQGVLAIGYHASGWVGARGMPMERVHPFAYFLSQSAQLAYLPAAPSRPFRFLFVGQFVERKRLDLLIQALGTMQLGAIELAVVGEGHLEAVLREAAESTLTGRVDWIGRLPMAAVPDEMARADCLVLPSRHDGWGAVVSEALMVGTPAICSDCCGVAEVVKASGFGGVFCSGDLSDLQVKLQQVFDKGRLSTWTRTGLSKWAQCLNADAGAAYLHEILAYSPGSGAKPLAPWVNAI